MGEVIDFSEHTSRKGDGSYLSIDEAIDVFRDMIDNPSNKEEVIVFSIPIGEFDDPLKPSG